MKAATDRTLQLFLHGYTILILHAPVHYAGAQGVDGQS